MSDNPIVDSARGRMAGYWTPDTAYTDVACSRFKNGNFILSFDARVTHAQHHLSLEDAEWLGAELTRMAADARRVKDAAKAALVAMQPVPDVSSLVEGIEIVGHDMGSLTGVNCILAGQDDEGVGF